MNSWEIDVAVLVIFFKRDKQFFKTFEAIKMARPRKLLLWQDGPRNDDDMRGILACRKIVENIDWDCEVYRFYNEKNFGCDPSTYYSHKWAFSIVDKCIVLEDDFVANRSFFLFCKELLVKYEFDDRINHICGMNLLGEYKDYPYDYFFGFTGTNAWASWKRVIDGWEESYSFLNDERYMYQLRQLYGKRFIGWHKVAKQRKGTGDVYKRQNPNNRHAKIQRHYIEIQELYAKKVMILGTGSIGTEIAKRLFGFDMTVDGYAQSERTRPYFNRVICGRKALAEEIGNYDYVISTLPDSESTKGFFDKELLSRMKQTSVIVNVGRKAVFKEDALFAALKTRSIGGAVLDMFERIPNPVTNRFRRLRNVIILPGVAAISQEVNVRLKTYCEANILSAIEGKR